MAELWIQFDRNVELDFFALRENLKPKPDNAEKFQVVLSRGYVPTGKINLPKVVYSVITILSENTVEYCYYDSFRIPQNSVVMILLENNSLEAFPG